MGSAAPRRKELCIAPRKGTAVVHFPCTAPTCAAGPLRMDPNADHESEVAIERKYVCQQFIWSDEMDGAGVDARLKRAVEEMRPPAKM